MCVCARLGDCERLTAVPQDPLLQASTVPPDCPSFASWLRTGLAFGAVTCLALYLFTEVGVLARWTDLDPWPWGTAFAYSPPENP